MILLDFVRSRLAENPKLSAAELRAEWIDRDLSGVEGPPTKAAVKRARDLAVAEAREAAGDDGQEDEPPTLAQIETRLAAAVAAGERGSEIAALVKAFVQLSAATPKGLELEQTEDWGRLSDPEFLIMAALSRKLHGAPNDADGLHALAWAAAYVPPPAEAHPAHLMLEPGPATLEGEGKDGKNG